MSDPLKEWRRAVEEAKHHKDHTVLLTRHAFVGEAELLYDALVYAGNEGVAVLFAPDHGHTAHAVIEEMTGEDDE